MFWEAVGSIFFIEVEQLNKKEFLVLCLKHVYSRYGTGMAQLFEIVTETFTAMCIVHVQEFFKK